jgi:hypothetical protein
MYKALQEFQEPILSKLKKLSDEVYLYENFLSEEECKEIVEEVKNTPDYVYQKEKNLVLKDSFNVSKLAQYRDRIKEVFNFNEKVKEKHISNNWTFVRMRPTGVGDGPHVDWPNFLNKIKISINESEDEKIKIKFQWVTILIYFNDDFGGGEIVYPEYGIEYHPKTGDLLVHNAEVVHTVYRVKSGERFFWQGDVAADFFTDEDGIKIYSEANEKIGNKDTEGEDFLFSINHRPILSKRLTKWAEDAKWNPDDESFIINGIIKKTREL